jgi:hypothetical protein
MRKHILIAAAATLAMGGAARAETKGYIISNWAPAMNNFDDSGCPDGKNETFPGIVKYVLKNEGMPADQIEKLTAPGFKRDAVAEPVSMRGRDKDGKPLNGYIHPLSVPDAHIKLDQAKEAFGFNLDGKIGPKDYTDPLTKEKGVDNAAARVFGCFDRTRGTLEAPPGNWSYRWSHYMEGNSWLMSISNNSDRPLNLQNEDKVTVTFYRGEQIPMVNSSGYQRDVTYTIDPTSQLKTLTSFKGKIRDGMFMADVTPEFRMIASSRLQPIFDFKSVHARITFKPDGTLLGFVGGYLPIKMIYFPFGDYAMGAESAGGMDVPGTYHALQENADTDIDKVGKMRTRISQTYQLSAVPAYLIQKPSTQKTAEVARPKTSKVASAH